MELRLVGIKLEIDAEYKWMLDAYREFMLGWFNEEKGKIDISYHYEIEVYRSLSITIVNEMKLEIDINLETVVNEYRVTINLRMDGILGDLIVEYDAWKLMIIE